MPQCDIAILYEDGLSDRDIIHFSESIAARNLEVVIEAREPFSAMACLDWLAFPAIAIFISKSYFDGVLKELGKDHFYKLKDALTSFTNTTMTSPRIEPVLIGSIGKINQDNPFSMALSIFAEANDGCRFKFLLPKPSSGYDYTQAINCFLEFLNCFHQGVNTLNEIGFDESALDSSKVILVYFNEDTAKIEWLDYRQTLKQQS